MKTSDKKDPNIINVLGVKINITRHRQINETLSMLMDKKQPSLIFTPNTEIIMRAQTDDELREILNSGDSFNLADGVGVLWAARYLSLKSPRGFLSYPAKIFQWTLTLLSVPVYPKYIRRPIPERLSGSDFIWDIADFAAKQRYKIFLLGGAPTVAERCALELQTKIPGLRIGGVFSGHYSEVGKAIEAIRKSRSEIILVAFGAPKQEKWLANNLTKTGCKVGAGLGGTFDYLAGVKKRAPKFIRIIGCEWLFRLICEPKRMARQLALPKFALLVLVNRIRRKEK